MPAHAIRVHETGGPDVLKWDEIEVGGPGRGEVRLRQTAVGVNFIDTYHRTGLYPLQLPATLGVEGAGIVDAVGDGVEGFKAGDRVAYGTAPIGAYAESRLYPAERLIPLPDWIDDKTAASMLVRGMTVEYLLCRTYAVQQGETILIQAAAGATGLIMCQWATALGAHVIGMVGSQEKVAAAEAAGAEHVLLTSDPNWVAKVRDLTDGAGVHVVYDGVGKDTFEGSLDCVRVRGLMVSFGNASGAVPPVNLFNHLTNRGSLFLTRPTLLHYTQTRKDLMESAASFFEMLHTERVKPVLAKSFALKDAAAAHRALESRKLTGSIVLLP